jgi:hypothetical protein
MNLRDFRKAAPYLGALLLAAVIFTVVRSLLLLRFYGARLPSKGLDTIIAQLAPSVSPRLPSASSLDLRDAPETAS